MMSSDDYKDQITDAVKSFWGIKSTQSNNRKIEDQGSRSSVTGGKHLDGFVQLLLKIAIEVGVPSGHIYTKGNIIPGYFRPSKNWDLIIIDDHNKLIAAIEFKSQSGPSFGNNFNNRTEEALGNAIDLWTAFRENSFPQKVPPWLGYLTVVEKCEKSTKPVSVKEPHYKVRPEFKSSSYLDRYNLLCQKLMLEKHYTRAALLWTDTDLNYGSMDSDVSIESFIDSFIGHLSGCLQQFSR